MRSTFLLAAASALLLAGCKGKGDEPKASGEPKPAPPAGGAAVPSAPTAAPSTTPAVTDACAVFSAAEVSAGVGVTVAPSTSTWPASKTADGLPLVQCGWEQGTGRPGEYTVHLGVENFASVERTTSYFNGLRVTAGNMSFEPLSGIGDEAIATRMKTAKQAQAAIAWRKGTVVYKLSIVRLDGLDLAEAEGMLVKIADATF